MSRFAWRLAASLALGMGALGGSHALAAVTVEVLSSHPQLVSGGDALIKVNGAAAAPVVTVDGRDVSVAFKSDGKGGWIGLVDGLKDGNNALVAKAGTEQAGVTLVSHGINATLFAGPQQVPFFCELEDNGLKAAPNARLDPAKSPDCAAVTVVKYFYRNKNGDWKPFDAANRPADLGTTTTTEGKTVPLIVRQELGVINRSAYLINILHDPAAGPVPTPTDRGGSGWNGKLLYSFGGGVQANYHMGRKIGDLDPRYEHIEERNVGFLDAIITRGYAIAGGSLNVMATNNDDVKSAETAYKVKEHFIEAFGQPIYTIANGVSGGSMQQYLVGNAYPGILDGLLPGRSYADTITFLQPLYDCELLANVFKKGGTWNREQMNAISGKYWGYCVSNGTRYPNARPDFCDLLVIFSIMADPELQKLGTRCTFQDNLVNVFGRDPKTGYARNPFDNVGVQYGLVALNDGIINFDQFIDINTRVGGLDVDGKIVAQRQVGDPIAIKAAYETGRLVEMTGGAREVPMISIRSYNDQDPMNRGDPNVDVHDGYHSLVVEARMKKYNGTAANYVQFMTTTLGFPQLDAQTRGSPLHLASLEALDQIDKWILAIQADKSNKPMAEKVIANKPADLVDTCWASKESAFVGRTERITDRARCAELFPLFGDARLAAGSPLTDDFIKCQLKPVDAKDYKVAPTAAQMAQLQKVFPNGVCDYSKPGVNQTTKMDTWAIFTGDGKYTRLPNL
jgi:hypothetical protein